MLADFNQPFFEMQKKAILQIYIQIESIKATSMEDISTRVLEKIKNI